MFLHSDRSEGLGFFGIIVRCSVFQAAGHFPDLLMQLNIMETGVENSLANPRTSLGRGSPSTIEFYFFAAANITSVLAGVNSPKPPSHLGMSGSRCGSWSVIPPK